MQLFSKIPIKPLILRTIRDIIKLSGATGPRKQEGRKRLVHAPGPVARANVEPPPMTTLPRISAPVKPTLANDVPADVEPCSPTRDDARWAAENLNDDRHDLDGPKPDWDDLAEEAAALDAHERGLIFA